MIFSPLVTSLPASTSHLMVVATVLFLVPARTVQTMSPFFADSSEPRSTTEILRTSLRTVQTGPLYGSRPKRAPVFHRTISRRRKAAAPPSATAVTALRCLLQGRARGRREETGARDEA